MMCILKKVSDFHIRQFFFSRLAQFISSLYSVYRNQYFTYLEINPLVVTDTAVYILDLAAKV